MTNSKVNESINEIIAKIGVRETLEFVAAIRNAVIEESVVTLKALRAISPGTVEQCIDAIRALKTKEVE